MSRHRSLATVLAALVFASPLAAQGITQAPIAPVPTASANVAAPATNDSSTVSVPRIAPVSVATLFARGEPAPSKALRSSDSDQQTNVAVMAVGGAALLVGALVGGKAGTVMMIGGGVVGLVGLWNYMR